MDWCFAWVREIGHLQQITDEQEKAGADQGWYQMMLFHVRMNLDSCKPPSPAHIFLYRKSIPVLVSPS